MIKKGAEGLEAILFRNQHKYFLFEKYFYTIEKYVKVLLYPTQYHNYCICFVFEDHISHSPTNRHSVLPHMTILGTPHFLYTTLERWEAMPSHFKGTNDR